MISPKKISFNNLICQLLVKQWIAHWHGRLWVFQILWWHIVSIISATHVSLWLPSFYPILSLVILQINSFFLQYHKYFFLITIINSIVLIFMSFFIQSRGAGRQEEWRNVYQETVHQETGA